MHNFQSALKQLTDAGIYIFVEQGKLKTRSSDDALTPDNVALIKQFKTEFIEYLSGQLTGRVSDAVIVRRSATSGPLSFGQQRLWLIDQIDGGSAHYNMPNAIMLKGLLDLTCVQSALDALVARHESLRTCFQIGEDEIVQQVVADPRPVALNFVDLSAFTELTRNEALEEHMLSDANRPFELSRDQMLRASVFKLDAESYVLQVTTHHIASDGWSMAILVNEFSALYGAYVQDQDNPLPPLAIQYADYAHWQRHWLQGEVLDKQLGYWIEQLSGLPAVHSLPLDYSRPAMQSFAGDTLISTIDAATTQTLNALCQAEGATLFMGLHAAFSTLLARYSNETDIVVGSPIANREQAEVAGLIGFFVNTLVLRCDLSGAPDFTTLLRRSKRMLLDAYDHQQVPFEQIVERLQPERSQSHSPLFQVMLVLQNNAQGTLSLPGLSLSPVEQEITIAKYDLTLNFIEGEQGLTLGWEYNADLFAPDTIVRMAQHFANLLAALVQLPEQSVFQADMLSAGERHQVLVEWNATQVDYPKDKCIHELFEEQVVRNPDAVAVVFESSQISYGELNTRANQLAHYLTVHKGVKPDRPVGICMERALEMVVAILGILKAGGAYVPLDPDYPADRLAYILEDAGLDTVLTQTHLIGKTPVSVEQALCLDDQEVQVLLAALPTDNPSSIEIGLAPSHLAYVIYTSGSTGRPKGVAMQHEAVVNLIQWQGQTHTDLSSPDKTLQYSALGFDVAFQEIFSTLGSGSCLVMINRTVRQDPVQLIKVLQAERIQRIYLPFVALQSLAEAADIGNIELRDLNNIVTAGEQLRISPAIRRMVRGAAPCRLHNHYGPTESHVVTALTLDDRIDAWPLLPSIGQPIPNAKIYVLNKHYQPVPIGVVGEIYIGGISVSRGYINRPELTAERFLIDPFESGSTGRIYKTGDLGRWLPNGHIEYIGRNDFQVKIRGFRIELGEIEAKLGMCKGVKDAAVLAREGIDGKRLVAYVVGDAAEGEALSHELRQLLPDYMVPSIFVKLDAMPLTPNGKVDRKALPEPELTQVSYVAPRTATELALCEIWQEILGIERVGITDNFFQLGGHSLTATRLLARINQRFAVTMPVKTLFQAQSIASLSGELAQLAGTAMPPLTAGERQERPRLSYAQQRLWLLDRIDGGSAHYNIPGGLKLTGQLDRKALNQALTGIMARHESLRTTFAMEEDGQPYQIVHGPQQIDVEEQDLSHLSGAEQKFHVEEQASSEATAPFNLEQDLMLRGRLLKLGEESHILLVTMHHIASDGWSMNILINELSQLYAAYRQGKANPLPALEIQYADYAHWQRQWLQGEVLDKQLGYWQGQLSGLPIVHGLPLDYPRPAEQSFAGRQVISRIGKETADALNRLCQQHGATLFMGLHAAFAVLLARYSNESDIVVGSPIANREQAEVAGLIGFFVNTLVLRSDVSGNPSYTQLLEQSRKMLLDAYAHQQVPFEQIVERLQPERSLAHNPLFQIMLVLQNNEEGTLALPGLTLEGVEQEATIAKYDLSLGVGQSEAGLELAWEYNIDLFREETIERMADHFSRLMANLVQDPSRGVHEVEMLGDEERRQILREFNATQADYPKDKCLQELFEEQARRHPEALALVYENSELSYKELNERANRLAHWLRQEKGIGPDQLVGICIDRSLDMVVAMLGILKAGGAYVPLDPSYPEQRLAHMLEDAGLDVVLTHKALLTHTPVKEAQAVCLDDEAMQQVLTKQPKCNPERSDTGQMPNHLAYIIYTSGSTGRPKGVMIEHGNVVNFVIWARQTFEHHSLRRTLFATSLNFDLSIYECFVPLITGQTIVLVKNALSLLKQSEDVSLINTVPSAIEALVDARVISTETRVINLAGEALKRGLAEKLFAHTDIDTLCNLYGPSETTTYSTWVSMSREEGFQRHIGRPINNTNIYLLDKYLQPVPLGVAGEIYIGGAGVARGYLNRPDLTEERFILDPFALANECNAQMYKTGDLGRYLADGNIEYLGRNDFQIKIRGFRIELGEIESALTAHEAVKDAIVLACTEGNGDKKLVAYVVGEAEQEVLRTHLSLSLPDYMVPSIFIKLDAMPLTPNGKVDRKALPEPELTQTSYVAPRTATELALCEIWQDILGIERVGITDNFFQLGGHSLTATRLLARINQRFAVTMPVKTLFQAQSIASLSGELAQLAGTAMPPLTAGERQERPRLSYAQQRLWLLDRIDGGSAHYNIPGGLKLTGQLDRKALNQALTGIMARHESLRTTFAMEEDGQPYQIVHGPQQIDVEEQDLSHLSGAEQKFHVEEQASSEATAPFNLEQDLMLRGRLLKLGEESHILLVTMHHIASDGWSMNILINELSQLYAAYRQGKANPLPALEIQYADYAHWQRQWLQGEVLDKQLGYWQGQLSGLPIVHGLPLDYPRPAEQSFAGRQVISRIGKETADALNRLCQQHGATLFMGLHAAFAVLLARYSNESDIVVGSPIANREQAEVAGLIGFFVNTLVLRSDVSGNPSYTQLLEQSRKMLLDAYAHQQVPFEQIVERLQPERSLAHNPLFQIMLVLQNNEEGTLALPGLTLEGVEQEATIAKYDLSLGVGQSEAGLELAWEYNIDLFREETIERMADHFSRLMANLVQDPSRGVHEVEMLGDEERRQILREFNATQADYPKDKCLQELFEEQARRHPEALALVYENSELSYKELNERANRLAHWLRQEKGIGPDQLVGICIDRSLDMVVAMLGILKAGGAYVPLDPSYPEQRLAHMLEDAGLDVVLTHKALLTHTPVKEAQAVCLDDKAMQQALMQQPTCNPERSDTKQTPQHLAYVIYTSGSTGKPKGVMVEHTSVMNLWRCLEEKVFVSEDSIIRVGLNAGISFDGSLKSLTQLLSGRCLVIIPAHIRTDIAALSTFLIDRRIDAFDCTPAQLDLLLAEGLLDNKIYQPKAIMVGGEAISSKTWNQLSRSVHVKTYNVYGPTECTVDATIGLVNQSELPHIGRPIANAKVYILDSQGQPVPIGVSGEIYIGGTGVARGYLNRPELTAERFVEDRFSQKAGARMYKTGDLGRWLEDGNIAYLGRNDDQIKIRGFRIELGEIETALTTHAAVKDAIVLARTGANGDKTLVAYVVGEAEQEALRSHLSLNLPEYMVPSIFVNLDAMPLTPNGKVDRKALPEPELTQASYVAPRTATELALCEIWQEILGIERVGITDNFFQLGGHSLMAMQLVARIRRRMGVEIPIRKLITNSTVADLVRSIHMPDQNAQYSNLVLIRAGNRAKHQPLFLIHPGEGEIGYARNLAVHLDADLPIYAIAAVGLLEGELPIKGVKEMASNYIRGIRHVQAHGPYRIAGWSAGGTITYEIGRQLAEANEVVSFLGLIDTESDYREEQAAISVSFDNTDINDAAMLLKDIEYRYRNTPGLNDLAALAHAGDVIAMIDWCRNAGILPSDVESDVLRRHVAVRASMRHSLANYVRKPISIKVSLFLAIEDRPKSALGWDEVFDIQRDIMVIGGTHYSIVEEPYVGRLAKAISDAISGTDQLIRLSPLKETQ